MDMGARLAVFSILVYWYIDCVLFHVEWCIRQLALVIFYHTL